MMNDQALTTELIHSLYAVEAEIAFVTAMLKLHMQRAESAGDLETVQKIRGLLAA